MTQDKQIIGRIAKISFPSDSSALIPAKIDTGADSSSVWASSLYIDDAGVLHYELFDASSKYYTGQVHTAKSFTVRLIRSSNGTTQVRYTVTMGVIIDGKKIRATFTLADRSKNTYPVLVGCKLLNRKFLVDVSRGYTRVDDLKVRSSQLNKELRKNPKKFFEKYHAENQRGDVDL